jgi:hypothetical protein
MQRFIAWQNLERYRKLLAAETDPARRAVLERLLAEEQEIWAGLSDDNGDPDKSDMSDDPNDANKP